MSSLRARVAWLAFALAGAPLLALGLIASERSASVLADQSLALQRAVAERVAAAVSGFVMRRVDELKVLDRTALLMQLESVEQQRRLERLLVTARGFQAIELIDADGRSLAFASRTALASAPRGAPMQVVDAGSLWDDAQLFVGTPRFDQHLREPLIDIAVPVPDRRSGGVAAVMTGAVRMKPVWDLLAGLDLPEGAEAYVVDSTGLVFAHRSPSVVLSGTIMHRGEGTRPDADGSERLTVEVPVKLGSAIAYVIVERSRAATLQLADETRALTLVIMTIALLTAGGFGLRFAARIARPVERLADTAARIAAGDFDARANVRGADEFEVLDTALARLAERLGKQMAALQASEFAARERAHVTLEAIGDAVISTDAAGAIVYLNPVARQMVGWEPDEAVGLPLTDVFTIINEHTRKPAPDPVARAIAEGKVQGLANHTVLVSRDGREYAIQDSAAPIKDDTGVVTGAVVVFSDVSAARTLQNTITHQATHDSLTDLVNRPEFEQRLRRVLETTRGAESRHALCYLDLDQFKVINDTCGHAAGDELLRQVAVLFSSAVRRRDTMARIGGDEFAVLMEHCDIEHAQGLAEKLRKCVEDLRFPWDGRLFTVGVSIGVVPIDRHSQSMTDVLRAADSACYLAKEAGRNRVHLYREDDQAVTARREEMNWVQTLTQALEEGRFELHAQPIIDLDEAPESGHPEHFELLLRLVTPEGERVLPSVFLRAAERYNLMPAVDRWVISRALTWLAERPVDATRVLCAINLSGQTLGDEAFLDFVLKTFDDTEAPGEQVCFEITETAAIGNLSRALTFINAVRRRGCKLALDDFGSGLSSFGYLKTLPVDILKIDGVFVRDIDQDELDRAMVRSINEVGHLLGMRTVAEFVESDAILEQVRALGINAAQGFGPGRPVPLIRCPIGEPKPAVTDA